MPVAEHKTARACFTHAASTSDIWRQSVRTPARIDAPPRSAIKWVLWRRETISGRETKVPYSGRGNRASSTNARDWASFEDTLAAWTGYPGRYAGLGFVFAPDDPFVGIDLDDCLDGDGNLKRWAQGIVERFSDTYIEISPSRQGLKIWAVGRLPANVGGVRICRACAWRYQIGARNCGFSKVQ